MPRELDRYRRLAQVTNNPNITLSTGRNLSNIINQPQPNAEQILADGLEEAINNILTWIDDGTGLDLVSWAELLEGTYPGEADALTNFTLSVQQSFASISASLQQSWLSFQNLLNGIVQETDADVAAAVAWLQGIGTAANAALTQIEDFLTTGDWSDLTTAVQDILQSIFGSSTSLGLVGSIPAPAVVNVTQNLQPVWDFPDAASLSGAGTAWSWDGTEDHTGVTGSGSAKVVANGVLQALKGIPGAVQPGQVVAPTAYVMWSGLTYTGSNPIQLQLIPYAQSGSELVAGTAFEVAEIASPASSGSWTHLTGTYTVPSSGVAAVQLRLVVTANATAGSVWWDDCEANLSGGFLADLQADSNNIIDSFAPGGTSAEFLTGVTNLLALFGLTPSDIGGATVINTVWTDVINDIINPLNALEISAINGLATALSALLGTSTFQSLLDSAANALGHSGTGHTIANLETYLGLIPPANVTNVLGGANLGADVTSVHTTVGTVSTTATNASTWSTRLTNDLLVLSDVFHLTYAAGTSTDPPGTLSGGKPTWYSCWNDLLALTGVVNSVTAPTDIAPTTGASITAASAAATTAGTNASMAISSASAANTLAQGTIDGLNTAWSAGGTGNPVTTIPTIAAAIPGSAVVGTTPAAVTFGAVGTGNIATGSATSHTATETHVPVTGDLGVLAVVSYLADNASTWSSATTYNGSAMTKIASTESASFSGVGSLFLEVWWLKSPAVGTSASVVSTVTRTAGSGSISFLSVDSASYAGSKVGTTNTYSGGGSTTMSMTASSVTNDIIFGAFVAANASFSNTLSGFSPTQRGNQSGSNSVGLVFGDGTGSSSVVFGATLSHTATEWIGITVQLTN